MKSSFEILDKVKHKEKIGIVQSKQYMCHMDMFVYLVKFDEFEIVLRENELEKV